MPACGPLGSTAGQATINSCQTNSDCPGGVCSGNRCTATSVDLAGLLLEVRIQPNTTFAPGGSYVVDPSTQVQLVSAASPNGAFPNGFAIRLRDPVSIKGASIFLDPSTNIGSCALPTNRSIPANITFFRVSKPAGLAFDPVQATTKVVDHSYVFDVELASNKGDLYDVYIEPLPLQGCTLTIPPVFLPAQSVDQSPTLWPVPAIGTLTGKITGLANPDGTIPWQLDLVDPMRGLLISAGSSLTLEVMQPDVANITASITPFDTMHAPILKLTPIDAMKMVDPTRPSIYWSLDGVGGTSINPSVTLKSDLGTNALNIGGNIWAPDGITGVASQLTIQSNKLQGDVGANASFFLSLSTSSASPGQFETVNPLPPGDYSIRASPIAGDGFSITDNTFQWPGSPPAGNCVCGQPFKLKKQATYSAFATTASNAALVDTTVSVTPSQLLPRTYLADTHTLPPILPRSSIATTDEKGQFSVTYDLGTVDLTIQPDPATNFPWRVLPQFDPSTQPSIQLTHPAFLSGKVTDTRNTPIPNAEIDAWFPVRTRLGGLTGTVVKIATTTTDANGVYTLVLPSSVPTAP
jgi:hypothetical protein